MVLTVSHAPPPKAQQPLDKDLRGYLDTNTDVVTRITKPVSIDDVGALSAQSEQPILFENIIEKPGFRLVRSVSSASITCGRSLIVCGSRRGVLLQSKPGLSRKFGGLARRPI